jgi:hypothetical protein
MSHLDITVHRHLGIGSFEKSFEVAAKCAGMKHAGRGTTNWVNFVQLGLGSTMNEPARYS